MKNFTSTQMSQTVYSLALRSATKAAEDIIKHMEFEDKDAEKEKLTFDLSIAFIVVAADCVWGMVEWDENFRKAIMDGVCNLYFHELEKLNHDFIKGTVDAGFFIRDKDEIALFCRQLPPNAKTDMNNFHCQTSLHTLALLLFNKRFLEYQELWRSDVKRALVKQPGFIPQMPHKVYEHWSGKSGEESRTSESLVFTTELFLHFTSFSRALAKQLLEITVNNE